MSHSSRTTPSQSRAPYHVRLLHSFAGVIPFTGFMLLDLWANAKAAQGPAAFERSLDWTRNVPTAALIALAAPMAFHAAVGMGIVLRSLRATIPSVPFALQRVTGAVALIYVIARTALFWLPLRAVGSSTSDVRSEWVQLASSTWNGLPLVAYVWLVALAACTFHLGHGLYLASIRWGLSPTRRRRAGAMAVGVALGGGAFLLGAHGVFSLATGWSPFSSIQDDPGGTCAPNAGAAR